MGLLGGVPGSRGELGGIQTTTYVGEIVFVQKQHRSGKMV